jgi:hypothetical protein
MVKKKNAAAAALAKLRAKSLSAARRAEIARKAGSAAAESMTGDERKARAKQAAAARWSRKNRKEQDRT